MQKLIQGIHQFNHEVFKQNREFFERLAKEQRPQVLFITCSDSRINPNLITQTEPGDLFILRNAGNIIPTHNATTADGESATIEFAISALGVRDIVVCGHSDCGAVKALIQPELAEQMPALKLWLSHAETTRRIIREKYQALDGQALLTAAVEENVLVQLEHLRTHPAVAAMIASEKLNLYGWVYKIETGQVFGFNPDEGQFLPLSERPPVPTLATARRKSVPGI